MTVEYFTPSKEDIRVGLLWMNWYKLWNEYFNDYYGDLIGHDFESLYTQEEKDALRAQPEPISIEFTSLMDFGESVGVRDLARKMIARMKPEDSSGAVISEFALPSQPIPLTFNPKFGIMKGDPKDFTPKSVVLKLSDQGPGYKYRENKVINGQMVTFYTQELPEDKS